jgi:hypothetical protein
VPFREPSLRRLEAHVFAPNLASARVLEKCGFIHEAVSHGALIERNDTVVDCLFYASSPIAPDSMKRGDHLHPIGHATICEHRSGKKTAVMRPPHPPILDGKPWNHMRILFKLV